MKRLVCGQNEFVYDEDGVEFIDAVSGVYNVSYGHCHPRIVEALKQGAGGLVNTYGNPTPWRCDLENKLVELTGFDEVHLFSTGAEAVEKALMLALLSLPANRRGVLHAKGGFHGKTMGTAGLFDPSFLIRPSYRSRYGDPPYAIIEADWLASLRHALKSDFGVVILEPVMAYYGFEFSYDLLRRIKEICDDTHSILIFDEMVTGFGRAGVNFISNVVKPHMLVTGKGLGQGLPISAVLFDRKPLNEDVVLNFSFSTATAGCAFLCRVGLESCKILVEEDMALRSQGVGDRLCAQLKTFALDLFEVWSVGSMVFVQAKDGVSLEPLETKLRLDHHILTRAHGSSLIMMPPFVTLNDSIDRICSAFKEVIAK